MGGKLEEAVAAMRSAAKASPSLASDAYAQVALPLRVRSLCFSVFEHGADETGMWCCSRWVQVGYWRSVAGDGEGAMEGFSQAVKVCECEREIKREREKRAGERERTRLQNMTTGVL